MSDRAAKRLCAYKRIPDLLTRKAFEELVQEFAAIPDARGSLGGLVDTGPPGANGSSAGTVIINLPYPFVLRVSSQLFPGGIVPYFGLACRVTGADVKCDPTAAVASANVDFSIQNDATSPSVSGTVRILSGARQGYTTDIDIPFGVDEKLYIKTPASLGGIQNLYLFRLRVELA